MALSLRSLHPRFAAEISGVDLRTAGVGANASRFRREALDGATVDVLNNAINQYGVLVFHDQCITDEQQLAFSRNFGELETTVRAYRNDFVPRLDVHVADISNLDERSRVLPNDDRRRLNALGNRLWHSDSSFKRIPARFSLLSARAIPDAGGETQFADMRAAWDALPAKLQARLEGLICEHTQLFSRGRIGFTDFAGEAGGCPSSGPPRSRCGMARLRCAGQPVCRQSSSGPTDAAGGRCAGGKSAAGPEAERALVPADNACGR
jgi:alpha-ketoglutarate-dependent 2,4-dichlorophenoxyacetate dioxygenase